MYIINTIPHGKCFVRYLCTLCFCIRNRTSERSERVRFQQVRFLIRQQLVRKYRTPALAKKYSLFIKQEKYTVHNMMILIDPVSIIYLTVLYRHSLSFFRKLISWTLYVLYLETIWLLLSLNQVLGQGMRSVNLPVRYYMASGCVFLWKVFGSYGVPLQRF